MLTLHHHTGFLKKRSISVLEKQSYRERQADFSFSWFAPQMLITAEAKAGARNLFWVSNVGAGAQELGPSLLFSQTASREHDWKWSKWNANFIWQRGLSWCSTTAALNHCFFKQGTSSYLPQNLSPASRDWDRLSLVQALQPGNWQGEAILLRSSRLFLFGFPTVFFK